MNITKYEELDQELYDHNIELIKRDMSVKAFCTRFDKKSYICINPNACNSKIDEFWTTEHELEHLTNNALYTAVASKATIKAREYKANDSLIKKFNLVEPTIQYIKKGLDKWEICEILEIPYDIFEHIINYIKRKNLLCL